MVKDRDEVQVALQARARWFRSGLVLAGLGLVAIIAGFWLAHGRTGDAATGPGVLAGMGFAVMIAGLILAGWHHPKYAKQIAERAQTKRDRLQAERSRLLWTFPVVGLTLLWLSHDALGDIITDGPGLMSGVRLGLPVLYAWLVVLVVLGWDKHSLTNRRFLNDELTQVFRARALKAAFVVLMAGTTLTVGLTVWRADVGIMAMIVALSVAAATAGFRYAWLDREANRADE